MTYAWIENGLGYVIAAVILVFILRRMADSESNTTMKRVAEYILAGGTAAAAAIWSVLQSFGGS